MNCKLFKIIITSFVFVFSFQLITAQTSNVIFNSTNNEQFRVTINNIIQHQKFSNNVQIVRLKSELAYNIKIEFKGDTSFINERIYLVEEGFTHIYKIDKKGIHLRKIVLSVYQPTDKNQLSALFSKNPKQLIVNNTLNKDTASNDTSIKQKFKDHYKLEGYDGEIGCPWPLKDENLISLKKAIQSKQLEDTKLEIAKEKIQDMDSICITTDQSIEILSLFQFEETKLEFARLVIPSLFDIDNIGKLKTIFDFENSMDELNKILKKDTQ